LVERFLYTEEIYPRKEYTNPSRGFSLLRDSVAVGKWPGSATARVWLGQATYPLLPAGNIAPQRCFELSHMRPAPRLTSPLFTPGVGAAETWILS